MSGETKALLGVLAATIVIIVGGVLLTARPKVTPAITEVDRLVREDDASTGPTDALVTVVEFGDFECPSCGAMYPILKQLKSVYANEPVRFVYRHYPLDQHEHAQDAAEASVEAQQQGKFWEYHDQLFENQKSLDRASLEKYAESVGLNMDAFKKALDEHTHRAAVLQDKSDGTAVAVAATPTIIINAVPYSGSYSIDAMKAAIDDALSKAKESPSGGN